MALYAFACNASALQPGCARDAGACKAAALRDLAAEACGHLGRVLPGQRIDDVPLQAVQSCEAPVASAPSALGLAAAVPVYLVLRDGPPSHAAFLFVHASDGWRLVDTALAPVWTHGGHCASRFALRWVGAAAEPRLRLKAERVCHLPLDPAEVAAGASSVASSECRTLRYAVGDNGMRRLAASRSDRRCSSM